MILFIINILAINAAIRTTSNTCSYGYYSDTSLTSIDIRQEITNLGPGSTIADLDPQQICNTYGNQDFITLLQIWIPSQYNYDNPQNCAKAQNYRELYNIKEYLFDPQLGSLTQLYQFLNSLRRFCPHLKILGEFSFYIGQDSYLFQNATRFLRRPANDNPNIQNPRYDSKGFVWARNDIGKRIPGSAVWNIFDPTVLNDIYDIQQRLIISQHQLDGISFIYPGLGLYQIANQFYAPEISAYGLFTKDFYQSWASSSIAQNYFNVGLFDSTKQGYKLLASYLQYVSSQINNQQPFYDLNHTFNTTALSSTYTADSSSIMLNSQGITRFVMINTILNATQPSCLHLNVSSYTPQSDSSIFAGMADVNQSAFHQNDPKFVTRMFYLNSTNQKISYVLDQNVNGLQGFNIPPNSKLELQYNAQTKFFKIRIIENQMAYQNFMIDYDNSNLQTPLSQLRYIVGTNVVGLNISISFPYYFIKVSPGAWINLGDRNIELKVDVYSQSLYQYTIVEPSVSWQNQIQILNVKKQSDSTTNICIGIAAKYIVKQKGYECNFQQLGCGAYLICSNGMTIHHSSSAINNQIQALSFDKTNLMSLQYQDSDHSLTVFKDSVQFYKFMLDQINTLKVLNFCIASITPGGSASLEY
ncbi:hypothetical protein pb186bvf_002202 [Paramecium bursaria]